MNKFIEISIYTFIFHILCYVLWLVFVVPSEGTNIEALGSLVYLPHAGRVLPVIFFGWQAIPAVLAAEFLEWEYLWQGADFYRTVVATTISTVAVLMTWTIFYLLGVDLQESDVLKEITLKGYENYESGVINFLRNYPFPVSTFIDGGANIGFYSVITSNILNCETSEVKTVTYSSFDSNRGRGNINTEIIIPDEDINYFDWNYYSEDTSLGMVIKEVCKIQ